MRFLTIQPEQIGFWVCIAAAGYAIDPAGDCTADPRVHPTPSGWEMTPPLASQKHIECHLESKGRKRKMRYQRILVKLSGGAIAGENDWGFDPKALNHIADEVLGLRQLGIQIGIVVGGGNIFRGDLGQEWGIERAEADNIGMIATITNSLMLRGVLEARGKTKVRVMSAISVNSVAEPFIRLRAIRHLEHGYIVILAAGTGNPYVTTDYPSAQRALELRAEALLVAKQGVDGIYTGDPHQEQNVRRYRKINYNTVIQKNLRALDQSAVLLARDHNLPIHLFDFNKVGAMQRICDGEDVGTLISNNDDEYA